MNHLLNHIRFNKDYRAHLPPILSRFTGFRAANALPPYDPLPIPPFTYLKHIPLRYEVWLFAWFGAFTSVLLIEAIMSTSTAFRDVYHAPMIITSFGASAVLVFGVIESPLSQPRNLVLGHFVCALIGTAITRLWVLNPAYRGHLESSTSFYAPSFVNGGLSMSFSLLGMLVIGAVHPPGGATGLGAAIDPQIITLSWRYLPVVLTSALIMLGWALIINNLGRRRYPIYWWSPDSTMVVRSTTANSEQDRMLEKTITRLRTLEAQLSRGLVDGGPTSEGLAMARTVQDGGQTSDVIDV